MSRKKREQWRLHCQFNREKDAEMKTAIREQRWPEAIERSIIVAGTIRILPTCQESWTPKKIAQSFHNTIWAEIRDTWAQNNGLGYAIKKGKNGTNHLYLPKRSHRLKYILHNHLQSNHPFPLLLDMTNLSQ